MNLYIVQNSSFYMSNPHDAQASVRPGLKVGRSNEFTMISALKPGGAERMRKLMPDGFTGQRQKNTDRLGTVQN
jgi:hypothetical protein